MDKGDLFIYEGHDLQRKSQRVVALGDFSMDDICVLVAFADGQKMLTAPWTLKLVPELTAKVGK